MAGGRRTRRGSANWNSVLRLGRSDHRGCTNKCLTLQHPRERRGDGRRPQRRAREQVAGGEPQREKRGREATPREKKSRWREAHPREREEGRTPRSLDALPPCNATRTLNGADPSSLPATHHDGPVLGTGFCPRKGRSRFEDRILAQKRPAAKRHTRWRHALRSYEFVPPGASQNTTPNTGRNQGAPHRPGRGV